MKKSICMALVIVLFAYHAGLHPMQFLKKARAALAKSNQTKSKTDQNDMALSEKRSVGEMPIDITTTMDTETRETITTYFYPNTCNVLKVEEVTFPYRQIITYYRDGFVKKGL